MRLLKKLIESKNYPSLTNPVVDLILTFFLTENEQTKFMNRIADGQPKN